MTKKFKPAQQILAISMGLLMLSACDNNSGPAKAMPEQATAGNKADESLKAEKTIEALSRLTPLTLDQMKALLPATLDGAPQSDLVINAAFGAPFAKGTYISNDSVQTDLSIFDCGGEAGAGIYKQQYLAMMTFVPDTEDDQMRVISFKGSDAIEHSNEQAHLATFTFFTRERFLVTLEGRGRTVSELKALANELKLK